MNIKINYYEDTKQNFNKDSYYILEEVKCSKKLKKYKHIKFNDYNLLQNP